MFSWFPRVKMIRHKKAQRDTKREASIELQRRESWNPATYCDSEREIAIKDGVGEQTSRASIVTRINCRAHLVAH
jgi:hypothetical protein